MGRYPPPVRQSRIAIATSEVIITRGGTPEETLVGEALNLSRLLLHVLAEPGAVVVDRTTKLLIDDLFEIRDLGAIETAGSQTVQAWRVDANRTGESRFEGSRARLGAITVGKPRLPVPDKPSIAVLPFANLSPDPEQEYFVDGIANDLITALSRYPSLLVIARNSSFSYKGIEVNVQRIGRELGVRYALEGSVRKVDARVRVTSQLIETESGTHIWANRYDANVNDIFAVQDEITHAVSTAIAPAVADAERHRAVRKPPDKHDSWSAYQRGLWHLSRATPEENKAAQQCFAEAIAIDANFSGGYTGLALAYLQESGLFAIRTVAEARISIKALALRAVANDESDAEAHACLSWALNFDGDYEGALAEARRALTISPNLASAHRALGTTLIFAGEPRQGLVATETSIRLDPRDPLLPWHLNRVAIAHYFARNYEAAVDTARRVVRLYPDFPLIYRWLAAALGQIGRVEEAGCALNKAVTICDGSFDMYVRERVPWHRAEDYEHMLDGLRKAGWRG
jgi:adenylate cyclase